MTSLSLPRETLSPGAGPTASGQPARLLPSGRSLVVRAVAAGEEELEVRDRDGILEVRIRLTPDGPVVQVRGGRLELQAADDVAVQCRRFEVCAAEGIDLRSSGDVNIAGRELTAQTEDDIHLNGKIIRLNC